MAGTIVHVILTGIVSLVPLDGGKSYLVRLQDTPNLQPNERHYPSIVVETDRLACTTIPLPDAWKPEVNPRYLAYKIANGELKITGSPSGGVDVTGLHDVLRVSDACPSGRECGVNKKTFPEVWVKVEGGALHTASLEPYRWHFSNEHESKVRRIAEEICWTFEIDADQLLLALPGGKTLSVNAPPGGDIEVRLQNVPKGDLIPTPETVKPTGPDPHIPLYFKQSKTPLCEDVNLLPEDPLKLFAAHPSHRLAGRRIVHSLDEAPDAPSRAAASGSGHAAHTYAGGKELDERTARAAIDWRIVRVNCPPALWDSLSLDDP
jgi:hypothetical protein